MDQVPAGTVDLYHSLLICGLWAVMLGIRLLKPPVWLQIGAVTLLILLIAANWFWPLHLYMPKRIGRPASIGLDIATLALILAFVTVTIRTAGKRNGQAAQP
jgi:hypothetical protein